MMGLSKFEFLPRFEVNLHLYALIIFTLCICPIIAIFALDVFSVRARTKQPRGCRKLGLRIKSNLADQYDPRYAVPHPPGKTKDGDAAWRVKSLWIYPVKSCAGVELFRGRVVGTGMEYDRQFSFAQLQGPNSERSESRWTFITQRQYSSLAKVKAEIWVPDPESPTYSSKAGDVQSGGVLVISFPYQAPGWKGSLAKLAMRLGVAEPVRSFTVPFNPTQEQIQKNGYKMERMTIWKDSPQALNMGSHIPVEFIEFMGISHQLSLFRVGQGNEREVFRSAPRKEELGRQAITGFADAYPIHMQNLASVRDVASKVEKDLPKLSVIRFRPNIIITGPPPYAEDSWKRIRIGSHEFFVVCRTARCRLPNVDPATGTKHPIEPDKTLKGFRCIDEGAGKNACLGMEMVPKDEACDVKVGNAIEVLEEGEHLYIPQ